MTIRAMGPELGRLCDELQDEVGWLEHKWSMFEELFDQDAKHGELLNTVSPNFFYVVHQLMYQDAMMCLSRFTDRNRGTLNVRRLENLIPHTLEPALTLAEDRCAFARGWRDRRLAHTNLATLRNEHVSPLPQVMRTNIEEAIDALRALLNCVEEHFGRPPSARFRLDPWGPGSLLYYLEEGRKAVEKEIFTS
jgi:HEPN superfamily AbiU2-like protein